jgi:glutamate-ammonia-ligase adenylyltransferase
VFEGLRQLHRKIRDEAQRRAAGRPERANDVKLSRGGIREIEFIVQLLLVVRGGQFPEIRTRSTVKALAKLAAGGLMKPRAPSKLAEAYTFLRRVEHRIQFLDDQQTHLLPTADGDLDWIAASAGSACTRDSCELLASSARCASWSRPSSTRCCTTARRPGRLQGRQLRTCGPPPAVDSEDFLSACRRSWPTRRARPGRHAEDVQGLREESKLRLAKLFHRAAQAVAADLLAGRRAALCRLGRAAAAPRELSGAAGRAALRCSSGCCACWAWRAGRCAT